MCALARVARLANRVKYIQVFYFLAEAIVELYPNACAIQEIEQHVVVLRDTLDESDELVSNLPWYQVSLPPVFLVNTTKPNKTAHCHVDRTLLESRSHLCQPMDIAGK